MDQLELAEIHVFGERRRALGLDVVVEAILLQATYLYALLDEKLHIRCLEACRDEEWLHLFVGFLLLWHPFRLREATSIC